MPWHVNPAGAADAVVPSQWVQAWTWLCTQAGSLVVAEVLGRTGGSGAKTRWKCTAAPMLAWSIPWCQRAWLARLQALGQGLDLIAVAAASQPETSVAASGTAVSSGASSLSGGNTGAVVSPRTPAVGVGSTASCSHWRSLIVATSGGTTVRRG